MKTSDGGADEHPTSKRQLIASAYFAIGIQALLWIHRCRAANFSSLEVVERGNTALTAQCLNNVLIPHDTFGKVALNKQHEAINPQHAEVERRNLQRSQTIVVGLCSGETSDRHTAWGKPIISSAPPPRNQASFNSDAEFDAEFKGADGSKKGGCGCGKGETFDCCRTGACRSCVGKNRQCTFRCACKGKCANGYKPLRNVRPALLELKGFKLAQARSLSVCYLFSSDTGYDGKRTRAVRPLALSRRRLLVADGIAVRA